MAWPTTTEKWMSAQMEGSSSWSDPESFTSYLPGGVTIGMNEVVVIFTVPTLHPPFVRRQKTDAGCFDRQQHLMGQVVTEHRSSVSECT